MDSSIPGFNIRYIYLDQVYSLIQDQKPKAKAACKGPKVNPENMPEVEKLAGMPAKTSKRKLGQILEPAREAGY